MTRETGEAAEHVVEPGEDCIVYSFLGIEAETGNEFQYPLETGCACDKKIIKRSPADEWVHADDYYSGRAG